MSGETTGGAPGAVTSLPTEAKPLGEARGVYVGPLRVEPLGAQPQTEASTGQQSEGLQPGEAGVSSEQAAAAEQDRAEKELASRVEAPARKIPPDYDAALVEASGDSNARPQTGTGEQPSDVLAEQQKLAQEQRQQDAYTEITNLGITLDPNSDSGDVLNTLVKGHGWQFNKDSWEYVKAAVSHAKARASQPEAEQPGASESAVAAEVGSADGQPAEAGDAPAGDRTPGQGAEATTGTSTTSGEGAASSDGATEDSTAPTSETTDTTASSEQPVTPEEMVKEIRQLRKENGDTRKILELVVGRMQKLDKEYEAFWKKALAILLLLGKPEFDAAFESLQEELKAG